MERGYIEIGVERGARAAPDRFLEIAAGVGRAGAECTRRAMRCGKSNAFRVGGVSSGSG